MKIYRDHNLSRTASRSASIRWNAFARIGIRCEQVVDRSRYKPHTIRVHVLPMQEEAQFHFINQQTNETVQHWRWWTYNVPDVVRREDWRGSNHRQLSDTQLHVDAMRKFHILKWKQIPNALMCGCSVFTVVVWTRSVRLSTICLHAIPASFNV